MATPPRPGSEILRVEVVYALAGQQRLIELQLAAGATVAEALAQSGLAQEFPEIDLQAPRVGIFSRIVAPTQLLHDGDRVEIYRPLQVDPKDARRARARKR